MTAATKLIGETTGRPQGERVPIINIDADVILRVLAAEATTPEPDSWGGDRAAARDMVYEFVAERERLRAEVAELKKRLGYPEFAR